MVDPGERGGIHDARPELQRPFSMTERLPEGACFGQHAHRADRALEGSSLVAGVVRVDGKIRDDRRVVRGAPTYFVMPFSVRIEMARAGPNVPTRKMPDRCRDRSHAARHGSSSRRPTGCQPVRT